MIGESLAVPVPLHPDHAAAVLTIDLGAVVANWRLLRDRVAPSECAAVVKADAYGLGMARVAPALAAAGCRTFFVAWVEEALRLRTLLPDVTIASLGGLPLGTEADHVAHELLPVLNHLGEIERWQKLAWRLGRRLPAMIHLDTGMNRLGLGRDERAILAAQPERLDGIEVRAWLTHYACADEAGHPLTPAQLCRFRLATATLPPAPTSLANSSGIFRMRAGHGDLVRPGCALYGINPTPAQPSPAPPNLAPPNPMAAVVRLEGRILQVRAVDRPMTVGYGASHKVEGRGRLATVAIGYADGYFRASSGCGQVMVAGVAVPVVGRVSMDLLTVDVSAVPDAALAAGDWVEVIGPYRLVDQVAREAGTIGYEVLTALGKRYHRIYLDPK
ncbi:Alanine racemase [uncultured Gammaproteobacteria bacterium]